MTPYIMGGQGRTGRRIRQETVELLHLWIWLGIITMAVLVLTT